jgi:hypothetical protein
MPEEYIGIPTYLPKRYAQHQRMAQQLVIFKAQCSMRTLQSTNARSNFLRALPSLVDRSLR